MNEVYETAEAECRAILKRMGVHKHFSAGELVEMANRIREVNKWISVDDLLPQRECVDVLVKFEEKRQLHHRITVAYRMNNEWGPAFARRFKITHWMPLPKDPK